MTALGLETLTPGVIGFGPISGVAGWIIQFGQKLIDATTPEESKYKHVFVVTSAGFAVELNREASAGPTIVQAMPSGAEEIEIGAEHWTPDYLYVRPAYPILDPGALERVADMARNYVGTPYSFLDYAAIAGRHYLELKPQDRTIFDRYVANSKHMICSQLADQAMTDAGWHTFTDGRLPQDVVPSALARQLRRLPGEWIIPGMDHWVPNPTS